LKVREELSCALYNFDGIALATERRLKIDSNVEIFFSQKNNKALIIDRHLVLHGLGLARPTTIPLGKAHGHLLKRDDERKHST